MIADLLYALLSLYLVAALLSLAHVLIIPEGARWPWEGKR